MDVCQQCPLRLFNEKGHHINGIGNIWSGSTLVLPNVDIDAYKKQDMTFSSQIEVLNTILPTGGLEQNLYVVPLIRCSEYFDIVITNRTINRCYTYLLNDITTHGIKNVMLCGAAARRLLDIEDLKPYLDTVILDSKNKVRYFVNYSPLVKYVNDEHFEVFKSHLLKYYNSIVTKMYDYEILIMD